MKVITSKLAEHTVKFPTFPAPKTIKFINNKALVTDEIAEFIKLNGGNFYKVFEDFSGISEDSKVLVIRDTGLGDVLMVTPFLRALKSNFKCHVTFATLDCWMPIFQGHSYIDKVLDMAHVPRNQYDFVIDLCRTVENAEENNINDHRVVAFGKLIDLDLSADMHLDYFITEEERQWGLDLLGTFNVKYPIAYVWTASMECRSWSNDKHAIVLQRLIETGFTPVLLCRDNVTGDFEGVINLTGKYSVRETAAIMNACKACLTPDTGLLHLASAIDLPTVCYSGAFPMSERATPRFVNEFAEINVKENCAKLPCRQYRCKHYLRDQYSVSPCLDVSTLEVVEKLKGVINAYENRNRKQIPANRKGDKSSTRSRIKNVGANGKNI